MKRVSQIKHMLLIVLVLNLVDGFLTSWGLSNNWIEEANPLMGLLSPLGLLCVKIALSGCIFLLWKTNFPTRRVNMWFTVLIFVVGLYSVITLLHMVWLFLLV